MKYRKKPVVIDAIQFDGHNYREIIDFVGTDQMKETYLKITDLQTPVIRTLEGDHYVSNGDFIIRGVHGEHYPCKPDIFEKTYERVE